MSENSVRMVRMIENSVRMVRELFETGIPAAAIAAAPPGPPQEKRPRAAGSADDRCVGCAALGINVNVTTCHKCVLCNRPVCNPHLSFWPSGVGPSPPCCACVNMPWIAIAD